MPEHNPGQLGGTMRLGRRRTVFTEQHESVTSKTFSAFNESESLPCHYQDWPN